MSRGGREGDEARGRNSGTEGDELRGSNGARGGGAEGEQGW